MPRKPGFAYDSTQPVAQANDIRRLRDAHQTTMNYNTGYMGLKSIDGQAYPAITQKGLKEVFESCYVPMDDGNKVLIDNDHKTMSQRGYGGFVKRKPVKVPQGNRPGITNQEVVRRYNTNVSVFTDFPKGAGHTDTQIAWRDGTYDQAVLSATKQIRGEIPDQTFADILRTNPRMAELALQAQAGAVAYGDSLARKEIEDYFTAEKKEFDRNVMRQMGMTDAQIDRVRQDIAREQAFNRIAPRLGVSPEDLRRIIVHRIGHSDETGSQVLPDGTGNTRFREQRTTDIPATEDEEPPEGYYYLPVSGRKGLFRRQELDSTMNPKEFVATKLGLRAREILAKRTAAKQAAFGSLHSERAKLANRPVAGFKSMLRPEEIKQIAAIKQERAEQAEANAVNARRAVNRMREAVGQRQADRANAGRAVNRMRENADRSITERGLSQMRERMFNR